MSEVMLRPMGVGDILDATFRLYRANFVTFALIGLVAYVPYALVVAPSEARGNQAAEFQPGIGARSASPSGPARALGSAVFALVVLPLCAAAVIVKVSAAYLDQPLSAWEAYQRALPRLVPLLFTNLFVTMFIAAGFLLLIVPGIIFSLWCLVAQPVVIVENVWGVAAIRRSRELMRDNLSKGFKVALAVFFLTAILAFALGLLVELVPWPHVLVGLVLGNALQALLLPIQTAPTLLLYYDLRIRKEAFDLEQLASSIAEAPPASSV